MRDIRPRRGICSPDGRRAGRGAPAGRTLAAVGETLAAARRAVTDRLMRWRGRPPEEGGVREPRRPRPPLPAGAVALDEPRTRLHRWMRR
ncbi:MAG TPA: hypothetical protein VHF26_18525 [Trebonia sp.]|nr:hypothetical protein [Trebonia sp.]